MKTIKKLLALTLVLCMVFCLSSAVFAADSQDANFTKTYKIINAGTSNPTETFTFTFTADKVTDSNANLTKNDMPEISNSTVEFTAGTATVAGLEKSVAVALSSVNWPGVGVYYYNVNETAGSTAGVVYDTNTAYLKVTVAYDEGTNTYYTAFVTMNLEEKDENGNTKTKTGGFTNEYKAGSLSIEKEVTGNMGNTSTYFAVKVTLKPETGKTYLPSYTVTGGSNESNPSTIAVDGQEHTFYLKDGDTITISNLPYGVEYTVVEDDYTTVANGAYDKAKYALNGGTASEDSISNEELNTATETVQITNNKSTNVDMGVTLDSLPYILALAVVFGGAVVMFTRKRHVED